MRNIKRTVIDKSSIEINHLGQSTESAGVQRSTDSDSSSFGLFEQHGIDYDSENFAREKEKEEKVRQRKKRGRGV